MSVDALDVNLFCRDLDRVFAFYRDLLDLEEDEAKRSPIFRALRGPQGVGLGFHAPRAVELLDAAAWRRDRPAVAHYPTFHTADTAHVAALCERAAALGGRVHKRPYVTYYDAYQAVLADPEENFMRVDCALAPDRAARLRGELADASHAAAQDSAAARNAEVVADLHDRELANLRRAIELSARSREQGRHPFAAIVVGSDGEPLAENINAFAADPTSHAELEAVRAASRIASREALARATMYSSAEPCAMCAGAIYWSGIGRVVYALSEARLLELTGAHPENPTLALPCREVFARGQRAVDVAGPALEDEAAAVHAGFWR